MFKALTRRCPRRADDDLGRAWGLEVVELRRWTLTKLQDQGSGEEGTEFGLQHLWKILSQ